jgi:hypothetical protein
MSAKIFPRKFWMVGFFSQAVGLFSHSLGAFSHAMGQFSHGLGKFLYNVRACARRAREVFEKYPSPSPLMLKVPKAVASPPVATHDNPSPILHLSFTYPSTDLLPQKGEG